MKLKKMLKMSLAVALVFGTAGTIVGCGKDDDKTAQKTQEEKVYDLYVSYMSAQGETPLTYEEWYASIKGAKGEKGDTGATGAPGAPGENGKDGKDGATWHYGTASTPASNLGVVGDFYFNTSTQAIYIKDANGWGDPIVIEDGEDAKAPQIRINSTSKKWEVSVDGGATWESTNVVAEGKDGENGEDGRGIVSITKTSTEGNVDTYTVTYTTGEPTTFTVVNGTNGEDGEDGADGEDGTTWHTGEGEPTLQQDLEAKEGDFYFDTLDNEIYLYDGENWISQVDLTEDEAVVEKLKLEDGSYTGSIHGYPFTVVVEEDEIQSLTVEGMGDIERPGSESIKAIKNASYSIDEGNEIVLTMEVLDQYGYYAYGQVTYDTMVRYLKLTEGNKFEISVNDEETELLKGMYIGNSSFLNVAGENFALSYDGTNLKGTWKAVDGDRESGEYMLELNVDGKIIIVNVNYFNRGYYVNVNDFSGTYTSEEYTLVYDSAENTVTFSGLETTNVITHEFNSDATKLYIEFDVEVEENHTETFAFVVDYLTSKIDGFAVNMPMPFVGSVVATVSDFDSEYPDPDAFYTVNEYNKLEEMYSNITAYSSNRVEVNVDLRSFVYSISIHTEQGNQNIYSSSLRTVEPDTDGVVTIANAEYLITIALNEDMSINCVDVESPTVVSNETELRGALTAGDEFVVLTDNIELVNSTLNINSGSIVVDLNGHTISAPTDTAGDGIFRVYQGAKLVINDSVGTGGINATSACINEENEEYYNDYSMAIWADGGEVVINGGRYTNVGAGPHGHYDLIYVKNNGKVTINGGTFMAHTPKWTLNVKNIDSDPNQNKGTITVYGGTFYGFNPREAYTDDLDPVTGQPTNPNNYLGDGATVITEGNETAGYVYTVTTSPFGGSGDSSEPLNPEA